MFSKEAEWVGVKLAAIDAGALSPMLNIGGSTLDFRTRQQPWIEEAIFAPLAARGVAVTHVDLKPGEGVDIAADILSEDGFARAKAVGARALMMCNILEHVVDPHELARRAAALVEPGGLVIVTVPQSYPHHRDPIDTMFRPTLEEVAALFPGATLVEGALLAVGSYRDQVKRRPWLLLRPVLRAPFPFLGWTKWKRSLGKLYWLVRPYRVSCVILRTPA